MTSRIRRHGFTLIELLGVIAIIGVLVAIVVPTINQAMTSARRSRDAANLRQVCLAYANFAHANGHSRTIPAERTQTVHDWAAQLAYHTRFNDASLYFVPEDPALSTLDQPAQAVLEDFNNNRSLLPAFTAAPPSITVVAGLPANAPAASTPIAWTRGLQRDGSWSPDSPYSGEGGYIGFLDGHVTWFSSLSKNNSTHGLLTKYNSGSPTSDIHQAVGVNHPHNRIKIIEPRSVSG